MRENLYILLLMVVAVPLGGELKFMPFNDDFRVSFGTIAFFFFLLWIRKIPAVLSAIIVGIVIVMFRIYLDYLLGDSFQVSSSFSHHYPTFFFYLSFASLFWLTNINKLHHKPFLIGILGAFSDLIANFVELGIRFQGTLAIDWFSYLSKISLIAIIRSFFVLSFFNMIQLRQAKWMEQQQRIRHEQTLVLISTLYEESIQLKKTLQQAEDITRDSYDLYRQLKEASWLSHAANVAQRALHIAGQVHEIKKDNQRIYAGLSKVISKEIKMDYMDLKELGEIIVRTNKKYAEHLSKEISFSLAVEASATPFHIYTTLSLMNNLVSNAVESIVSSGTISISMVQRGDWLELHVSDDGPGIKVKDKEMLFKPGFTTKFDISGRPSTGIGLAYVKEVVESLSGTIAIVDKDENNLTVFTIRLPVEGLIAKGG